MMFRVLTRSRSRSKPSGWTTTLLKVRSVHISCTLFLSNDVVSLECYPHIRFVETWTGVKPLQNPKSRIMVHHGPKNPLKKVPRFHIRDSWKPGPLADTNTLPNTASVYPTTCPAKTERGKGSARATYLVDSAQFSQSNSSK